MKKTNASVLLVFVPGLLMVGCLDSSKMNSSKDSAVQAISAEGQAITTLFISDMADASVAKADVTAADSKAVDESVKDDTKKPVLANMAAKMLDRLDSDDSGSLSEAEFLGVAAPMDVKKAKVQSAEDLAAKQVKMKEEFAKYAGADSLLDVAEIEAMFKAQGDRIGKFRNKKHHGRHKERVKEVKADVLAKFDLDKDGKLSKEEIEALRAADKADRPARADGKGKEKGKGHAEDDGKDKGENEVKDEPVKAPETGVTPVTAPLTEPAAK